MDARGRRRAEAEREHQLAQGRTRGHVPPGWPPAVLPVDVDGWTDSALTWLLDHGRPEWRLNPTLRRQPLALARFARELAHANVTAARAAWLDLPLLEGDVAAGVRALLEREGPRLAALREIWQQAAAALRDEGRAHLIGYSLPVTDLVTAGLLQDNLPPAAPVNVTDPNPDNVQSRLRALGFTTPSAYGGEHAVHDLVEDLVLEQARRVITPLSAMLTQHPDGRVICRDGDRYAVITDIRRDSPTQTTALTAGDWEEVGLATSVRDGKPAARAASELLPALEQAAAAGAELWVQCPGNGPAVPVITWHPMAQPTGQGDRNWAVLQPASTP